MNVLSRHIIPLMLLLLLSVYGVAQPSYARKQRQAFNAQMRSNITLSPAIGLGTLMLDGESQASGQMGIMARVELGYTFFDTREIGFHAGLGVSLLHSGMEVTNLKCSVLGEEELFNEEGTTRRRTHFTGVVDGVKESWNATFLSIPLQMVYQDDNVFLNAGVRVLLPISVTSSYEYGSTELGLGNEIDGMGSMLPIPVDLGVLDPERGSYKISSLTGGEGIAYIGYACIAIDGGYRFAISDGQYIVLGAFFEMALNRTAIGRGKPMVDFSSDNPSLRYAMQSDLVSSLRYLSFGLTATYQFSFGRRIGYRSRGGSHNRAAAAAGRINRGY